MTDRGLPADYDPSHVLRVVAAPLDRGWAVSLRDSNDKAIVEFGLKIDPGAPFMPDVLGVLGPILNKPFGLAYVGTSAWDEIDNHWSAIVYPYAPPEADRR